jgi:hypothetical protein
MLTVEGKVCHHAAWSACSHSTTNSLDNEKWFQTYKYVAVATVGHQQANLQLLPRHPFLRERWSTGASGEIALRARFQPQTCLDQHLVQQRCHGAAIGTAERMCAVQSCVTTLTSDWTPDCPADLAGTVLTHVKERTERVQNHALDAPIMELCPVHGSQSARELERVRLAVQSIQ